MANTEEIVDRVKELRDYKQKMRMKVSNLITRKNIDKVCCYCGEKATIVHNPDNPYYIAFACTKCRKNKELFETIDNYRFDVREYFDKRGLNFKFITDEYIKDTVEGYLNYNLAIGTYCDKLGISRHQFRLMIEKYIELYPDNKNMANVIEKHSHKVKQQSCREVYDNRMRALGQPVPRRDRFGNNLDKKPKSKSHKSRKKAKNKHT